MCYIYHIWLIHKYLYALCKSWKTIIDAMIKINSVVTSTVSNKEENIIEINATENHNCVFASQVLPLTNRKRLALCISPLFISNFLLATFLISFQFIFLPSRPILLFKFYAHFYFLFRRWGKRLLFISRKKLTIEDETFSSA